MAFNVTMTQEPAASKKPAPAGQDTAKGKAEGKSEAPAKDQSKNQAKGKGTPPGKGGGATSKGQSEKDPLRRSRAGGFYVGVIALGIVLVLLIIFIVQNTGPTTVRFLAFEGETPVAVALLIAAAAGLFLAGIAASLRIFQLRRRVKSDRKK